MKSSHDRNNLFPIFLKTESLRILLVGGGETAAEKIRFLLKSSPFARIKVVAPVISPDIRDLVNNRENVTWIGRKFQEWDLEKVNILILATNDNILNKELFRLAHEKNILVNTADSPSLCDFYLGSIVTRGVLKIAFSTNGASPVFAKRLREYFEENLPDETLDILDNLALIRKNLKGDFREKLKILNQVTQNMIENGY